MTLARIEVLSYSGLEQNPWDTLDDHKENSIEKLYLHALLGKPVSVNRFGFTELWARKLKALNLNSKVVKEW